MAKDEIKDYQSNPDLNSDIGGTNIAEGCPPSSLNNALRTLMAHLADAFGQGGEAVLPRIETMRLVLADGHVIEVGQDAAFSVRHEQGVSKLTAKGNLAVESQNVLDLEGYNAIRLYRRNVLLARLICRPYVDSRARVHRTRNGPGY